MSDVIAVSQDVVQEAGAIVYWRLTGRIDIEELEKAWLAAGLDSELLRDPPTPMAAMRRALNEHKEFRRLVRRLEKDNTWAIVDERAEENDLDYMVDLRITLDKRTALLKFSPPDHPLCKVITDSFWGHLETLTGGAMSAWLVELAESYLHTVGLRDAGGFYFVPRQQLPVWRTITEAIASVSGHKFFSIPAMPTDDAVEAILDAITNEARSVVADIEDQLLVGNLGEKALGTRELKCRASLRKVKQYEGLLGVKMEKLREQLTDLETNIGAAMLALEEED